MDGEKALAINWPPIISVNPAAILPARTLPPNMPETNGATAPKAKTDKAIPAKIAKGLEPELPPPLITGQTTTKSPGLTK